MIPDGNAVVLVANCGIGEVSRDLRKRRIGVTAQNARVLKHCATLQNDPQLPLSDSMSWFKSLVSRIQN
jgi:hypothetical protein